MPRSRQFSTRLTASDRPDAANSPASQARLMSSTSARCSAVSRSSQFGGFRRTRATAATASRRLDEPVAEGVKDAGDVSAALGDRFLADLGETGVECLMDFRLQAGAALEPLVDENLGPLLGIRPERPPRSHAAEAGVPPEPDSARDGEVVVNAHRQ